ncbi:MAG: prephenate dehydratase [Hydrogenobacter thermophilus]|uniref:prephenate dehydratase n=1 Tax=Hydrogenobacter thermophilus TaxID=940 RepID=UPI001C75F1F7|nr:prephenate dehydratase [Hydrogenobacter thermophilus]QWK18921.1 MAG: prephenate dehydratase [Hydrogenobacter thermophilus]
MEEIALWRKRIDEIDEEILRLLNERIKIAQKIGEIKKASGLDIHAPEREREIFERVLKLNEEVYGGEFPKEALFHIYREIMSACLSVEKPLRVAYLGPKATFTHQAALEYFGFSVHYIPVSTIKDVFNEVDLGRADYGVVPVENTIEGVVNYTLDMFLEYDLKIVGEVVIPIKLHLLSNLSSLEDVKRIYSHRHAIAQCRNWIDKNLPKAQIIETESTARACEIVLELNDAAAIASEVASYTYHLNILAQNIQESSNNFTRFLIIGNRSMKRTGKDKTSLILAVRNKPGDLYKTLESFYLYGVNLTKIESRPSKKRAWDYVFFVDLDGHVEDHNVRMALDLLAKENRIIKMLGSYPKALFEES